MHEIVTLQFGEQANFVATHFWNTQESYFTYSSNEDSPVDHDVHFKPGIGADGADTYTPRAVIYDFKKNYGSMRKVSELYENEDDPQTNAWGGGTSIQREPQIPISQYHERLNQNLESIPLRAENVVYWSDFGRVFFHPKSIVQALETDLSPEQAGFSNWQDGSDLFMALNKDGAIFDETLRPFVEECDQMQGFQIMASVDDGWSGFTAKYIEGLRDDFGKIPIWVWALGQTARDAKKQVNQARSLQEISSQASIYIPMTSYPDSAQRPPYLEVDSRSRWCTSALQAMAFESATLPSRLRADAGDLTSIADLTTSLNLHGGRNVVQLQMFLPAPFQAHGGTNGNGPETQTIATRPCDFFPFLRKALPHKPIIFNRVDVLRGNPLDQPEERAVDEEVQSNVLKTALPFPELDSFPNIFKHGERRSTTAMRVSLETTSLVKQWTKSLENVTRYVGFDERESLVNGLKEIGEAHSPEYGDDSSDEFDSDE